MGVTGTAAPGVRFCGLMSLSVSQLAWGPPSCPVAPEVAGTATSFGVPANGVWAPPTVRPGSTLSFRSAKSFLTSASWLTNQLCALPS